MGAMRMDRMSLFERAFVGRTCSVARREHDWAFSFGEGTHLGVSIPWRIVTADGIVFAEADDNQQFGLPQPIDGQALTNKLLSGRRVAAFDVDARTADLRITFDGEVRLEMFNYSSGYEGWSAAVQIDGETMSVVGLGGGGVVFY